VLTVGGGRLATVVGVLGDLLIEQLDLVAQLLAFGSQGNVLSFQHGEVCLELIHFPGQLAEHANEGFQRMHGMPILRMEVSSGNTDYGAAGLSERISVNFLR